MSNWQTTAKTIFCEAVDDEVTVMVHKDFSAHCTGCKKYSQPNDMTKKIMAVKKRQAGHSICCEGEGCQRVSAYQATIRAEEENK
jgi:hypothetical protein